MIENFKRQGALISILVPVYNTEQYLQQCLDSIINQTLKNIEIICVNDGSTDSSLMILQKYAQKDQRIRIINKIKNEGTLLARKTAVLNSIGEYIVFVDPDDYLISEKSLEILFYIAKNDPKDIISYDIDTNNKNHIKNNYLLNEYEIKGNKNILTACFLSNKYNWVLWGKLFKSSVCKMAISYVEKIYMKTAEDAYIYFLISYHSKTFKKIKTEPLYFYRVGNGITTNKEIDLSLFEEYCKEINLIDILKNFLKTKGENLLNWNCIIISISSKFFFNSLNALHKLNGKSIKDGYFLLKKFYFFNKIKYSLNLRKRYKPFRLTKYFIINIVTLWKIDKFKRKFYINKMLFDFYHLKK